LNRKYKNPIGPKRGTILLKMNTYRKMSIADILLGTKDTFGLSIILFLKYSQVIWKMILKFENAGNG
jgi:hypothetical protein